MVTVGGVHYLWMVTPSYGPSPADDRLYVAIMHSGVSLAAITGDLVARELADGVGWPYLAVSCQ